MKKPRVPKASEALRASASQLSKGTPHDRPISRSKERASKLRTPLPFTRSPDSKSRMENAVFLGPSIDLLPKKVEKLTLYEPIANKFYASKIKRNPSILRSIERPLRSSTRL